MDGKLGRKHGPQCQLVGKDKNLQTEFIVNSPQANIPAVPPRKPRLLWANVYCLLDTASGASMTVRQMLLQLVAQGYEIEILGATIFDHETGTARIADHWPSIKASPGQACELRDGPLLHHLLVTASTRRGQMTSAEQRTWFYAYLQVLDRFRPDVLFYYGGQPLDFLIAAEARARGIPVAFYLANGTYTHSRWCRDVDLILTNSQTNVDLYRQRLGVSAVALGPFVDPARVVAHQHEPRRILFINPSREKGAVVVIRLAMLLERRRPDIVFEVVESRGNWGTMLHAVSSALGQPRRSLDNVIVTAHTHDMRPVYGRARLLLAPSLWWESMGRVLVEGLLNGIPAIVTDSGGMPEMVQDAGIILKLDAIYHEKPYTRCPPDDALQPLLQRLETLYDDEAAYARLAAAARRVGQSADGVQRDLFGVAHLPAGVPASRPARSTIWQAAGRQRPAAAALCRQLPGVFRPPHAEPEGGAVVDVHAGWAHALSVGAGCAGRGAFSPAEAARDRAVAQRARRGV